SQLQRWKGFVRVCRRRGQRARSGVWTVGPSKAPLAQMRPRFAGADSTPRTRVTRPPAASTRSRQPTPQYGQTLSPTTAKGSSHSAHLDRRPAKEVGSRHGEAAAAGEGNCEKATAVPSLSRPN